MILKVLKILQIGLANFFKFRQFFLLLSGEEKMLKEKESEQSVIKFLLLLDLERNKQNINHNENKL